MALPTIHRGFEARAPYNTVEPVKEEEELIGSQFLDTAGQKIQETIANAAADQEGIGDDIVRLGLGGLKNIGHVANLPGIKQGLQIAGAPAWALGQTLGAGLEHGLGIDPRYGQIVGEVGGDLLLGTGAAKLGKLGAIKGAHKLVKTDLPGQQIARKILDMHIQGGARKAMGGRQSLSNIASQQAPEFGNQFQLAMTNVAPSHWHRNLDKLKTLEERIAFFNTPTARSLNTKVVKGGKITANQLARNEDLTKALVGRAEGIIDRYMKGDQRKLYDFASHNIFNDADPVYGTGLVKKIQQTFLVTQGREWHHIFGNKEAGEFLLNKISQDPVLTANLFKHMDKLQLKSGAIAENMALMRVPPHKAWHKFMQQIGTESRVKMQAGDTLENLDARGLLAQNKKRHPYSRIDVEDRPVRMGTIDDARTLEVIDEQPWKYTAPLDVADYGHAIAEAIYNGQATVDEFFKFLTAYHEKYVPWMKEQLKNPRFAAEYLTDLPDGPEKAILIGLYKKQQKKR